MRGPHGLQTACKHIHNKKWITHAYFNLLALLAMPRCLHISQATEGLRGRVNQHRIVLWGTSYSGGHSLAVASQLGSQISGVRANFCFGHHSVATLSSLQGLNDAQYLGLHLNGCL